MRGKLVELIFQSVVINIKVVCFIQLRPDPFPKERADLPGPMTLMDFSMNSPPLQLEIYALPLIGRRSKIMEERVCCSMEGRHRIKLAAVHFLIVRCILQKQGLIAARITNKINRFMSIAVPLT